MAIFEGLSGKLQTAINRLKGMSRVTEKDIKDIMREVKLSLLEADVSFKVVKEFISNVSERAVGADVLESLSPGQQVIKIVHDELVTLLGGTQSSLTVSSKPPTIYMLVGLQGSGKTTTAGKLANVLRKKGKKPLLVACDVYRPAAIDQLKVIGGQLSIPVFTIEGSKKPVEIAKKAIEHAEYMFYDTILIDTAGRLQIDEEMMNELVDIKKTVRPQEILLVVDSMTGQVAVDVAEAFKEKIGVDGLILTKLDGDTRGGAALSVKKVTGTSIKFACTGEKLNEIEPFFPDRMASRILGMGDVLSLIEKAQEAFDDKQADEMEKKFRKNDFNLEDFLDQMRQMKKMGPLGSLLQMIPGLSKAKLTDDDVANGEKELKKTEAIICSMTLKERRNPDILSHTRRIRIAKGSGTTVQDLNKLIKNFEEMKKMMKNMKNFKGLGI
ncbi:MAG: signal recognition particle protein [Bacillota bacterium]